MLWTNRGKFLLLDWVFGGEPLPDNFYVALVTADNVPTVDTNTLSELTEIADGNGYTEGGYELTPGTPDFDVIIEDDDNNLAYIQIKDILWTAAGGNIPASGNGARYVVLTDDSESSAAALGDRQIIAVWDMVTDRVATNGFPISLTNLELRTVGLGGAVSTDSITEGEDAAPADPYYGEGNGYVDTNDFSAESDLVAHYRFDDTPDFVDSSGLNGDLAKYGSWSQAELDTVSYITGIGSAMLDRPELDNGSPTLRVINANQDANFPGRIAEAPFTISFWYLYDITSKNATVEYGYIFWIYRGQLEIELGFLEADEESELMTLHAHIGATTLTFATTLPLGRWYHISLTYNGTSATLRVWDNTAGADAGLDVTAAAVTIGQEMTLWIEGTNHSIDDPDPVHSIIIRQCASIANVDELLMFKRALTGEEIDAIRAGTFGT